MDGRSLFPISPTEGRPALLPLQDQAGSEASASQQPLAWLSNPSFSESLLPAIAASVPAQHPVDDVETQPRSEDHAAGGIYDRLLSSSDAGDEEGRDEKKRRSKGSELKHARKKHKKSSRAKKRQKDDRRSGVLEGILGSRLVDSKGKEYHFDTRGDRDNLTYGSLYRMDVARFYRHQTRFWTREHGKSFSSTFGWARFEEDDANVHEKVKAEGRYWSAKFAALERRKDFKRLRLVLHPSKLKSRKPLLAHNFGDFIAVDDLETQPEGPSGLREESWDDAIIRKTREFNQSTRESPHDESLWIAFANFQDEIVNEVSRKPAVQQALEKKIAVLEKALEFHPFSEDLLLLLMDTCRKKDPAPTLASKWENLIKRNPGSCRLWKEYLRFGRREFSLFTVSSIRKLHVHAIQTFLASHYQKDEVSRGSFQGNDIEVEKDLVSLFVDLCCFEWQTGYHELAIGLFQAQLEYSMFPPPISISEPYKKRLFKEFWESGAPRIGEDGAAGWAAWLQKEEERISAVVNEDEGGMDLEDREGGGWTGWSEPLTEDFQKESITVLEVDDMIADENDDVEGAEIKEDEIMLLERLGLNLESGQEVEVKNVTTWKRWSVEENKRDTSQWLPLRTAKVIQDDELLPDADDENDDQLQRAVLFEDVRECLFSLKTMEARFELICHMVDFCDGPYPQWCCSNSVKWKDRMESLENLSGLLLKEVLDLSFCEANSNFLKDHVAGVPWVDESSQRSNFLCNVVLLVRPLFPDNFWLQKKLLTIGGHLVATDVNSAPPRTRGFRTLAKKLLKNDRQAVLLWGAYGELEAAAGNIEVARKIFDTTLASLGSLPEELQMHAPILYLCYAKAELSDLSCSSTKGANCEKLLHMLSCLGCGVPYTASSSVSSTQILKAKNGFRQLLQDARKRRVHGDLTDQLRALIECVVFFEFLAYGNEAAGLVFEESLAMSLPGKRQESLHFELLHAGYIDMLEREKQRVKPAILRSAILRALTQYPDNLQLLGAYVRASSRSICTNDLRRYFDEALHRKPTVVLCLLAISIELRKAGSGPRIHSLFERALENLDMQQSVLLWRSYLAYELYVTGNTDAVRRVFFRAIHACPWSKALWLDGFQKMSSLLTAKELSELQDIMRDKELRLRTDVYEILLDEEDMEALS